MHSTGQELAPEWPPGHKSKCTWTQGKGRLEGPGEEPCALWSTEDLLFLENFLQGLALARPQLLVPAPGARTLASDLLSGGWADTGAGLWEDGDVGAAG